MICCKDTRFEGQSILFKIKTEIIHSAGFFEWNYRFCQKKRIFDLPKLLK